MPFGVVSEVGRGIGVLDGGGHHQRERSSFGVNAGVRVITTKMAKGDERWLKTWSM